MKPNFALDLSHDGIVLLHRAPNGHWTEVGDVPLDDPDLRKSLSFLRSTAVALEGKGFATKLVLPNSQILYREIHAPGPSIEVRQEQIKAALEGETPYALDDLTFDWTPHGTFVQVAVVANETLDEAEGFAVEHRFNPISFVGRESPAPDAWEPFFGRTDYSFAFLGAEADVRDTPAPDAPSGNGESLFAELPPAKSDNPEVQAENIFVPDDPLDPDEGMNSLPPDNTPSPAAVQQSASPTFSSRRQPDAEPLAESGSRPLARVTPRIAILPDSTQPTEPDVSGTAQQAYAKDTDPAPAPDSDAIRTTPHDPRQSTDLRDAILGREATTAQNGTGLKALAPGLVKKLGLSANKVSSISLTAIKSAAETVARAAGIGAKARKRRQKPAPKQRVEPTLSPPETSGGESGAEGQDGDPGAAAKRLKLGLSAVAAVVLLAGFGGYYLLNLGPQERPAPRKSATPPATRTAIGGRAERGPPVRPSDLAQKPDAPIRPIRPARRSVFEGRTDPLANLPATATPVTTLSEQELADIRAAGLNTPTPEELAEASNPTQSTQQSDAKIVAAYKASGALQFIRIPPAPEANPQREDIYVATVDRALEANDATILPDFNGGVADQPPVRVISPLDPGITVSVDANGLVKPTPGGTLNPDGILVRSGKPPVLPPQKPQIAQLVPPDPLAALKPKPRPSTLKTGANAIYVQGKLTLIQLRKFRARPRPLSIQQAAPASSSSPSELAVLTSFKPSRRPSDFDKIVKKARVQLALATPATAPKRKASARFDNVGPRLPTKASVAKRATIRNAINLSRLNLIGVYGTPSRRSALLRLPSGRFVKVKIGDRVDGGKVAAIGTSSLSFVKSGRNRVLKIPN